VQQNNKSGLWPRVVAALWICVNFGGGKKI
jgi:hypothetical protein